MHSETSPIQPNKESNVNYSTDMLSSIIHQMNPMQKLSPSVANLFSDVGIFPLAVSVSCCMFHDFGSLFPLFSYIKGNRKRPGWDGKYELHPLLLCQVLNFFLNTTSWQQTRVLIKHVINDRAIKAEHTGHLHSLCPGFLKRLSSYRNSSLFVLAIDDCSSPRGYTWEH